ncbi:MAG: hypothetical protein H6741_00125 [Alphaproteobacteria bacterium]|nr:hypothetical protein [Alphaproteobacteria bacterium]MCB9791110.1 hypothetical protein [Alphaproteobacteria bacterium]
MRLGPALLMLSTVTAACGDKDDSGESGTGDTDATDSTPPDDTGTALPCAVEDGEACLELDGTDYADLIATAVLGSGFHEGEIRISASPDGSATPPKLDLTWDQTLEPGRYDCTGDTSIGFNDTARYWVASEDYVNLGSSCALEIVETGVEPGDPILAWFTGEVVSSSGDGPVVMAGAVRVTLSP